MRPGSMLELWLAQWAGERIYHFICSLHSWDQCMHWVSDYSLTQFLTLPRFVVKITWAFQPVNEISINLQTNSLAFSVQQLVTARCTWQLGQIQFTFRSGGIHPCSSSGYLFQIWKMYTYKVIKGKKNTALCKIHIWAWRNNSNAMSTFSCEIKLDL